MRIGSFEFNLRELAGSMGDFGTLLPLAIGYIAVCGMDPCGLLVAMGVANIVTGLVYRLPMPIEPMKVLAVVAIAQAWTPGKVLASGLVMGASLSHPRLVLPDWRELWPALRDGGLAQIPLTATNAVIATSALITQYWPERRVTERQISLNMGLMNLVLPFFGGMPLCHGAGGLAGQYYFGARTGGTNVIEGLIEIALGVFLAGSIASIFAAFPTAIVGAMMFLVGIELVKFARDLRFDRCILPVAATVAGSVALNMAAGFGIGLAVHWVFCRRRRTGGADAPA